VKKHSVACGEIRLIGEKGKLASGSRVNMGKIAASVLLKLCINGNKI